ncbi:MAG: polysaccharide deacetylase [Acidimicrobiaceae bacterium]|nr:polysaccharide deacetylase [Acidimicrobiaceae bacterium]
MQVQLGARAREIFDRTGNLAMQPPRRSWFGRVPNSSSTTARRVALTFDDGPSSPSSALMLDTLASLDVRATFFCVGQMVAWYPEIARRAASEGHVIANHSMYHSRRRSLSPWGIDHIESAQDEIERVIGRRPALYRPPWGWTTPWELRRAGRLGLTVVGWSVYPDDWKDPEVPAATTARQIVEGTEPGSIILMHDATSNVKDCAKVESAAAVELAVRQLRADGYEFVALSELLGVEAYLPTRASSTGDL